uniref:Amphiphysin n=1 Tax=Cynoglossus semilaevis TaxID=244447 RepID=A0A3P8WH78_CYNSE
MAEIKTGIFAKNVQKRLNRAQEKVLQKLGKADETKDEQFEQVVLNFRRQETEGSRLQREMKSYLTAIKGMQQASINLTKSLHEVYEPDWFGQEEVMSIGKDCDAFWEDFHNKLVDSTLLNLDEYLQHFPDLKTRVAKRSRKLIDYDSARHHLETLQAAGMKNDRKMMKAEEELKKAQRVFDELDVGLQDELPSLWDSRVGFYIGTFKSVTSLETKFHREISLVCKQLYEVMTQLGEQHSDKMFTIQGAPSDSGPLRLARTPSPPEDMSPPESPDTSSNHTLRPVSPGPPRPKSPTQFKKGPPVPPPPKVTPTKEVAEEQIIDLFGGEFLPAPSPSQPNERPGESLLDLDFDDFQPDESVSPIPQTAVPWDVMWSANCQVSQPATDGSFVADWSADFSSMATNGESSTPEAPPTAATPQDWSQADSSHSAGDTTSAPQEDEDDKADGDEDASVQSSFADFDQRASEQPRTTEDIDQAITPPAVEEHPAESSEAPKEKEPESTDEAVNLEQQQQHTEVSDRGESNSSETAAEIMSIPSVVIEPASSNEGDDDRDADIMSPSGIGDNGVLGQNQNVSDVSPSGLPDDFLFRVETMHDFEAANSDELELKRGEVVLVVPTASVEDLVRTSEQRKETPALLMVL